MLDTLTLEDFLPCMESEFNCSLSNGANYTLKLHEAEQTVRPGAGPGGPTTRLPFSLIFLGPTDPVLPQGIYPLEHATLGMLPIFIVPIGRDASGVQYQAIFS